MNALRNSLLSLALCSLFVSSLVYADDCGDALVAESCACRSDVRSGQKPPRGSGKGSPSTAKSTILKNARAQAAQRTKSITAPEDTAMPGR